MPAPFSLYQLSQRLETAITVGWALRVLLGLQPLTTTAYPLRVLPTMSGRLCIAIRLGYQKTIAKSLVKPDLPELHIGKELAGQVVSFVARV